MTESERDRIPLLGHTCISKGMYSKFLKSCRNLDVDSTMWRQYKLFIYWLCVTPIVAMSTLYILIACSDSLNNFTTLLLIGIFFCGIIITNLIQNKFVKSYKEILYSAFCGGSIDFSKYNLGEPVDENSSVSFETIFNTMNSMQLEFLYFYSRYIRIFKCIIIFAVIVFVGITIISFI